MKKKLLIFSIAFLGLTFLQAQDTIQLSSGKVIVANIRRDNKKKINLELEEGAITFSKDQFSSIHKRKDWPWRKFERINIIAGLLLHKFSRQHNFPRFVYSKALPGMLVGLEYSVHESRISHLRIAGQYRISKTEAVPPNLSNILTKIPLSATFV